MREVKCPQCKGKGEYGTIAKHQGIEFDVTVKCEECNGVGKIYVAKQTWPIKAKQ